MPTYTITGARGGIGLEYVAQLSRDPANTVVALVRSASSSAGFSSLAATQATSKATVHILECDVASEASISALPGILSAALGDSARVDVLINNAATLQYASQTSLTLDAAGLEVHMTSNVLGPARMVQVMLPFLTARGDGEGRAAAVVANITSGAGSLSQISEGRVRPVLAGYSLSKAALNMLTVHQAKELRSKGVIVVVVDPGHVKTAAGGPGATVEVEDSAGSVLRLLAGLRDEDSGRFYLYNGTSVPW
ncbi:C-factor [Colletotrichum spaethianum]|uniref:C-factor n=1 Tax=Colletotrichum spaethianum TaxID=700344 RepID=A0AA37LGV2_9PEZI|nr:C-factor [Colletotrichum spaethianum]GKT47229.1 C-factor [Colletotrichum spaethianum]